MTNDEFYNDLDETQTSISSLATTKGREYSGDTDRLLNFKRNAAALGLKSSTIWAVYSAKHWDAIMQHVRDLEQNTPRELSEPINGRINDLILYLILLKGILREAK
jgi:hypothetical protein